jgi:hypothetical protein
MSKKSFEELLDIAELEEAKNTPYLSTIHMLCTDFGIPQGHIEDRVNSFREECERLKEEVSGTECICCPECHCADYVNKNLLGKGFRQCKQCGQEWWTDINYGKIDLHTKQLQSDCRVMAEAVKQDHASKCTYPGGEPHCLWDEDENCAVHEKKEGCRYWKSCTCPACEVGRKYMGGEK